MRQPELDETIDILKGATGDAYAAFRQEYKKHPARRETRRYNILASIYGIPAAGTSFVMIVDGTRMIQEAPTTSQTILGIAEVLGGLVLFSAAGAVNKAREHIVKRGKRVALQDSLDVGVDTFKRSFEARYQQVEQDPDPVDDFAPDENLNADNTPPSASVPTPTTVPAPSAEPVRRSQPELVSLAFRSARQ